MNALEASERVEEAESELVALQERRANLVLVITFPPPGCRNRPLWRSMKREELQRLDDRLAVVRAEHACLYRQVLLSL